MTRHDLAQTDRTSFHGKKKGLTEALVSILIVDDDDVYRELIRDVIEEEGVLVTVASDGVEAVEKLNCTPIDILITDLHMPRMDGLKLLAYARQIYPHILSIIITGYGSLESAIEGIRQGAYDYVQKPFKIERIALVIKNAIEKVKILRDRARLLTELNEAYRKLQKVESDFFSKQQGNKATSDDVLSESGCNSLAYANVPLHLYQLPVQSATYILTKLDTLRDLKREGVIDDKEFSLLKSAILENLGSRE